MTYVRRTAKQVPAALLAGLLGANIACAQRTFDTDILADTFGYDDDTERAVELDKLRQGCPERDCIPSIDEPVFVAADRAAFVSDDDPVIGIERDGYARAYPTRILDFHEIVNDTIAGEPIAITWCPLCGSAVGLRREIDGVVTEFGVSGLLYNSDLVLYDRRSETLWDQIDGEGIVGPRTGEKLDFVPVTLTRWGRWRDAHPDTRVLSADTGAQRDYSGDPYASYRESSRLFMPVSHNDDRIHPKAVVFGFHLPDGPIAFAESVFEDGDTLEHEANGEVLFVARNADGSVELHTDDGGIHAPVRLFWFAWYTFNPETQLIR